MIDELLKESTAEYQETQKYNLVRATLKRAGPAFYKLNVVLASVGGLFVFLLMLLISASVLGRYLFNRPIPDTLEISESVLVLVVYWALTYREMVSEHVRIEILTMRFSPAAKMGANAIVSIIAVVFSSVMCWRTFMDGLASWGEKGANLGFNFITPVALWIPKLAISLGFAVFTLYFLLDLYARIILMTGPKRITPQEAYRKESPHA